MEPVIDAKNVSKIYQLGKTEVNALNEVDLQVNAGDFMSIAGSSGSGKTTLLNLIGCLEKPSSGNISISGKDVSKMNSNQLADIRNHKIGFIFQNFNLIPVLTAYENIEFPLLLLDQSPKEREEKIMAVMKEVGIENRRNNKPEELSGGQRQRVAIARALVKKPEIILADEPTANLDSKTGQAIIQLMLKINQEKEATFVFSTHDKMIMEQATSLVKIHDGSILVD